MTNNKTEENYEVFEELTLKERNKRKTCFLFLDIEWNQKAGTNDVYNREPIQIALLGTDNNFENTQIFSKSIRLDDVRTLTNVTCKITHTNDKAIMMGNSLDTVFKRVQMSFPKYQYIVVWTLETYELFKQSMKKADVKLPKHKILILQDIINIISQPRGKAISFKNALDLAKITYEKNYLHYSKHDVKYLFALYQKTHITYQKLTADEFGIVNEKSKILHTLDCRYTKHFVKNAKQGKKALLFCGYRPCKCCGSEEYWRRIYWKPVYDMHRKYNESEFSGLPLTEENIHRVCTKYNINYSISEYVVFLTTNCGYWRVYLKGEKVDKVFHGNYKNRNADLKKKKKFNEGFHHQKISMTNFFDVVRYIYYHDKDMYERNKMTHMEVLFKKIEREMGDK